MKKQHHISLSDMSIFRWMAWFAIIFIGVIGSLITKSAWFFFVFVSFIPIDLANWMMSSPPNPPNSTKSGEPDKTVA